MIQKQMPFGMPVKSMEYYPNQLELRLYWHNTVRNIILRRTYVGVPPEVAYGLYYKQSAKDCQAYIQKFIKGVFKVSEVKQM